MGAYIPSLLPLCTRGALLQEIPKRGIAQKTAPAPLGPCPFYKGNHWRSKCPCLQVEGGVPPPMDWWFLGLPVQAPLLDINVEEPQVDIIVEKWRVMFLLDDGACFSVLSFSPGSRSNNKFIIRGISGQPLEDYFTWPLACSWGYLHFCHSSHSPWDSSTPAGMGFTISTKGSNTLKKAQYYSI
jgi:hypothetical protein